MHQQAYQMIVQKAYALCKNRNQMAEVISKK